MTDISDRDVVGPHLGLLGSADSDTSLTPAGLQSHRSLTFRRLTMLALNAVTMIAIMIGIATVFNGDGIRSSVWSSRPAAKRPNLSRCLTKT